ncbi:hypothetical protein BT93_E0372 [Corymbia citriodora subsp. variegata]|nr:hypothetical protein BT93_E0372 [Corymbia citriodora subsp. variegata]
MAAAGGFGSNTYRNGVNRSSLKAENKSLAANQSFKSSSSASSSSSFKSRSLQFRKSSPAALGGANGAARDSGGVPGRVRVAVRLRPRNAEELAADADFADCVELQPELKRLKLRKNNWDTDTYEFDEVFTEFASQKRVYEVVAKPVVESVLEGYNGTVMAYGQTGTGKTYTLGKLGEEDTAARGIMVRAMEDILGDISLETDSLSVSYLQLYMETIQDLLDPSNDNISIVEDPKTGDVSLPGATLVEVRDQQSFLELLRLGEAHRFAANTKLNTESSRSHAILMVNVKRYVKEKDPALSMENGSNSHSAKNFKAPVIRKGKLVVVDLAGSERIDKSGSEGHTLEEAKSINLSLSALGKCINALAENSAHVPVRDSKLTRLLRDSFGGTARTSLVITIGPSPRHRGETMSTIMFGQRAMKVENMLKLKEEFDYKSLSRRLELQLDKLIAEHERQQKAFDDEIERIHAESEMEIAEAERKYADALEKERMKYQKEYMESIKKIEEQLVGDQRKHDNDIATVAHNGYYANGERRRRLDRAGSGNDSNDLDCLTAQVNNPQLSDSENGEKASVAKLFEQVGLHKILSLLEADDADVRIHAVKVVANLAAEEANQQKIVDAGGLMSLLNLLRSTDDETIHRVAAGAIANLAMNETNQELIMAQGGIRLLSTTAANAGDPQTLRMVAGAIANLCGNDKLQTMLRGEGGIKALLGMVHCGHPDVLAQVARGIANFAKCESRASAQGTKTGRSLLIEDGALPWVVQNAKNEASAIRRHIELALCHLAQHEVNAKDMISGGALWELVRISRDCSREDIRTLARRSLASSSTFKVELRRLRMDY